MIEHYPNYERTLRESLRELVGEEVEKRVDIGLAKDGSGVGGMWYSKSYLRTYINTIWYSGPVRPPGIEAAQLDKSISEVK